MKFEVLQTSILSPYWSADVSVYNCNKSEIQNLLAAAKFLTLSAGYQAGPSTYAVIWDGPILQKRLSRENGTDWIMNFNCVASLDLINRNIVNVAMGPMSSQYQAVQKFAGLMAPDVTVRVSDFAQQLLSQKQYPGGKSFFGKPTKYLSQIADDNFLNMWTDGKGIVYLTELSNPNEPIPGPDIIYAPPLPVSFLQSSQPEKNVTRSLIGSPTQTQFGIDFRVLLDPRLRVQMPPVVVKIDEVVVQQMKMQIGQVMTPLDVNGVTIAYQVRHIGDSRGNDWYTEVVGVSSRGAASMLKIGVANGG